MSRRATFAALAALAAALPCAALPLGLRLTQAAVTQAASAKQKDPLLMTEEEAYEAYAPDTAFLIDTSLINTNEFVIMPAQMGSGTNYYDVDWGDGTFEEHVYAWYWGTEHSHTYAKPGRYVIRIRGPISVPLRSFKSSQKPAILRLLRHSDYGNCMAVDSCKNATCFPDGKLARWPKAATSIGSVYCDWTSLKPTELPEWPSGAKRIFATYQNVDLSSFTRLPDWPEALEFCQDNINGSGCYKGANLSNVEVLPEWPKSLKSVGLVYYNSKLDKVTRLPEWPDGLTNEEALYYGQAVYADCPLSKVTHVPKWPAGAKNFSSTYRNCKLTHDEPCLPAWPTSLTQANSTYQGCSSLAATSLPAWPTSLTQANSTYQGCSSLAATSLPEWKDCTALTQAIGTYAGCVALTSDIVDWPPNVQRVDDCYRECRSLSATRIPEWPQSITYLQGNTYWNGPYWNVPFKGVTHIPDWPTNCTSIGAVYCTYSVTSDIQADIPPLPATCTTVGAVYHGQKSLTGARTLDGEKTEDPAVLMPPTVTSHHMDYVSGASASLRALFYSDWGGSKPKPTE